MKTNLRRKCHRSSAICVLVTLLLGISTVVAASGQSFTSFDFPGAIDIEATGITPSGVIVGRYTSADGKAHGFLMSGGTFVSIDFPGAISTDTTWINPRGQIVGSYNSPDGKSHGYLLSDGNFTQIDYPGANATTAFGISPAGDIVGLWSPAPGGLHGYLLSKGNFTTIHFPGALWTLPTMIVGNRIVGGYFDHNFTAHGFLLQKGNFQNIDCPGYTNLFLSGLNPVGEMTGGFTSTDGTQHGALVHGFYTGARLYVVALGVRTLL